MPQMKVSRIGHGAGTQELKELPNMLRIMIGEKTPRFIEDTVCVVEANIDDMSPQSFEYIFERLFAAGALDVFLTPIQMKKNRPGTLLSVICGPDLTEAIALGHDLGHTPG